MLLQKTDKARLELLPGVRTLSVRERSLLLLVEGRPLHDLQAMYNGIGAQIVDNLMRQGYLQGPIVTPEPTPPTESPEPGESLRSLAGARMYLFDTCERLFARRDPAQAEHYRQALRAAKDRASMLDVGMAMFEEVALAAGADRAATLRERLEQLLPQAPITQSDTALGFESTQPAEPV